ncbi:MAG: tetratricopeptide repeat protein [Planctomycetes bacterium]|nr:tetratricopeptide repeat protein [Planctomycetota bacterium]
MQSPLTLERGSDPCLQIQVDLSAMLDGELDAPSVRRVMVHSDVCAQCRGFLESIRTQARLHRCLDASEDGSADAVPSESGAAGRLRRQLMENQQRLGQILYELGRGFVLMGLSPDFSREVAKEPVPVPDMAMRGRNLVDEVTRLTGGSASSSGTWVAAKELFDQGHLRTPTENLGKGQRLLAECLVLQSDHHEARIYLGLVHHVRGQRGLARRQFTQVLTGTDDRIMRAFALLNLGNVHLDEGDCEGAAQLLTQLVESGVVQSQPRFGMAYFNLALAYGLLGRFEESHSWFQRLHEELPHKRAAVARELTRRSQFVHLLRSHPEAAIRLERSFPAWFPVHTKEAC